LFFPWSVFDLIEKRGQDFESLCNLTGGFGSLTQPDQQSMVCPQAEHLPFQVRSEKLDRLDHCQEFLPGCTVILLSGGQSLAVVGDNHFPAI